MVQKRSCIVELNIRHIKSRHLTEKVSVLTLLNWREEDDRVLQRNLSVKQINGTCYLKDKRTKLENRVVFAIKWLKAKRVKLE